LAEEANLAPHSIRQTTCLGLVRDKQIVQPELIFGVTLATDAAMLRERALEVIRLADALAELDDRAEKSYETEFEEPALLTLGCCYQKNGRFSGGAYHPVLKRCETFLGSKLSHALAIRRQRAEQLMELDAAVVEAVNGLKARGFESPYLKAFVLARINPLRFTLKRGQKADFDETIGKMLSAVKKFDAGKVKADQVARAGGARPCRGRCQIGARRGADLREPAPGGPVDVRRLRRGSRQAALPQAAAGVEPRLVRLQELAALERPLGGRVRLPGDVLGHDHVGHPGGPRDP